MYGRLTQASVVLWPMSGARCRKLAHAAPYGGFIVDW